MGQTKINASNIYGALESNTTMSKETLDDQRDPRIIKLKTTIKDERQTKRYKD